MKPPHRRQSAVKVVIADVSKIDRREENNNMTDRQNVDEEMHLNFNETRDV